MCLGHGILKGAPSFAGTVFSAAVDLKPLSKSPMAKKYWCTIKKSFSPLKHGLAVLMLGKNLKWGLLKPINNVVSYKNYHAYHAIIQSLNLVIKAL